MEKRFDLCEKIVENNSRVIVVQTCREYFTWRMNNKRMEQKYPSIKKGMGENIIDNIHFFPYSLNIVLTREQWTTKYLLFPRVSVVNPSSCSFFPPPIFGHCSRWYTYLFRFFFSLFPLCSFFLHLPLSFCPRFSLYPL